MGGSLFSFILVYLLHFVSGYASWQGELCGNNTAGSCTTQILGRDHDRETCKVEYFPSNSAACKSMNFGPISSNTYIGGVSLKPYILLREQKNATMNIAVNYTVLNITFSNIKWKTMKFRFQASQYKKIENHCRNIVISNDVTVNDQSVLYYDCYWSLTDGNYNGQSHTLDFEATDDKTVNRGKYFFKIPSPEMLSHTVTEEQWKPFVYIEVLTTTMKLHILPPPPHLKITSYRIEVMRRDKNTQLEEVVNTTVKKLKNVTDEVTTECTMLSTPGSYYFVVTPLHLKCTGNEIECRIVESPIIILSNEPPPSISICIASVAALVVAALFAYYVVLLVIRQYWCNGYRHAKAQEIPAPTKVLVIYSPANRLHAECVATFVTYLRSEFGFDIMYDGDISQTAHGDPYLWAEQAFQSCTHVLYVVGPTEDSSVFHNIYDKPIITAHKDVDRILLTLVKTSKVSNKNKKDVSNVFFEHSNGKIPIETMHDKVFFLLKDWHKLISYLSKNMLPKVQIMRTEKGRSFLEELTKAKKLLGGNVCDVRSRPDIVKCEKIKNFEGKVLL